MPELLYEVFTDEFHTVYIRPETINSFSTNKKIGKDKSLKFLLKYPHLFTSGKTFEEVIKWIDKNCLAPTIIHFPKNNISKKIKNKFKTEIQKTIKP